MSKFMAASRQAYELDQEKVRLEAKICEMQVESSCQARVRIKLKEEVKELKNLVKELKADVVEKDNHLDHLQKRSDELCTLLGEANEAGMKEFKASSEYIDLLDKNYTVGVEDFRMEALKLLPEIDFSLI